MTTNQQAPNRRSRMHPLRHLVAATALVGSLVALGGPASAQARPDSAATTETFHRTLTLDHEEWDPCLETVVHVTAQYDQLVHRTTTQNGTRYHGKIQGTVTLVPLDNPDLAYTGRWNSNLNMGDDRDTSATNYVFRTKLDGTDGSTMTVHERYHVTVVDDHLVIERERQRCHLTPTRK